MSLARAHARPSFEASADPVSARPERRGFSIVAPAPVHRTRPRIAYALVATTGVVAIVVAQLLLSVGISQGAYEVSTLQSDQVELGRTTESVSEDLVRVSSPQSLAANAESLGMVSNSSPVYLRLSDGAVLGAPASATGSQAGAASLVPNALLSDVAVLTPAEAASLSVADGGAASMAGAPVPAAPTPSGLPSPTTR
ncbi:MAG: hypothetical protein R6W83_06430 [Cryobacterium sp.]